MVPSPRSKIAATFPRKLHGVWLVIALLCTGMMMKKANRSISGVKHALFPRQIGRALKRRDGGCRFLGCSCTRFVDAHHIQHWADGGETSMNNLVLLCRKHHRLVHEEGFGLNRGADGAFNFTLPDGTLIPPGPDQRFRGNFVAQKVKNSEMGEEITSDTPIPNWCEATMDNDLAVLGLLQRE